MILAALWRTLRSAPLYLAVWMELPLKSVIVVHWRNVTETAGESLEIWNNTIGSFVIFSWYFLQHFFLTGDLDRFCFSLFSSSCVLNTMCTATASTVIDFRGHVHSVPDRCGYTLLTSSLTPGLQVQAVFQERRRRDLSLLDRVLLRLHEGRVQFSLEQGSRVYVSCQSNMLCWCGGPWTRCEHDGKGADLVSFLFMTPDVPSH